MKNSVQQAYDNIVLENKEEMLSSILSEFDYLEENQLISRSKNKKTAKGFAIFAAASLAAVACILFAMFALPQLLKIPYDLGNPMNTSPANSAQEHTVYTSQRLCSYAYKLNDWIYYINEDDNGYIYRIKTDGTQNTKLSDINCNTFRIAGEWIFFNDQRDMAEGIFQDDGFQWLFKMRLDGSDFTKIPLNHTGIFEVFDNSIFYIEDVVHNGESSIYYEPSAIYKMDLDGTNKIKLTENIVNFREFQIHDGFVYYYVYQNGFDDVSLYRMKPDGSENKKMLDNVGFDEFDEFEIFDDWVYNAFYYESKETEEYLDGISRTNVNSGEKQKIIDGEDNITEFTVYNDSIYYITGGYIEKTEQCEYSIKKANIDGTGKTKLADIGNGYSEKGYIEINIADGYIYFTDQDENGIDSLFRISLNGSEKQKVQLSQSNDKINSSKESEGLLIFSTSTEDVGYWMTVRTDGKDETILLELFNSNMQIAKNKAYSSSSCYEPNFHDFEPYGIWIRDLNGKNKKLIYPADEHVPFKIIDEHMLISTKRGLIRTDLNGKNKIKLLDDGDLDLENCIIIDDWLYYVSKADKKIYKVSMDGKSKTSILIGDGFDLGKSIVIDGWAYYVNPTDKNLYKASMNGRGKIKLTDHKKTTVSNYMLYDNALYYNLKNGDFYKLDLSSDKPTKLFTINAAEFTISDDVVYFSNAKDNKYLYKISLSGGEASKIRDGHTAENIVVAGDVIYYINEYNYNIYRINTDGGGNKRIASYNIWDFTFIAD